MSKRKFSVIELFAGAGGLALGFEEGGFETKLLVENWKYACETLKANRPDWNVLCEGVENVDWNGYKADVVTGGFPCQILPILYCEVYPLSADTSLRAKPLL